MQSYAHNRGTTTTYYWIINSSLRFSSQPYTHHHFSTKISPPPPPPPITMWQNINLLKCQGEGASEGDPVDHHQLTRPQSAPTFETEPCKRSRSAQRILNPLVTKEIKIDTTCARQHIRLFVRLWNLTLRHPSTRHTTNVINVRWIGRHIRPFVHFRQIMTKMSSTRRRKINQKI